MLDSQIATLLPHDPHYPADLARQSGPAAPACLWAAGPLQLLDASLTAFFCSARCPGSLVLPTFDAITALRDQGRALIGGFHSPMEWECLRILLRGRQPIVWVPARGIGGMRLKPELQPAFAAGRLLVLSPFAAKHKRITAALAETRNRLAGALATRIFAAHAAPSSRTLALCTELRALGKPIDTIRHPSNRALLDLAGQ